MDGIAREYFKNLFTANSGGCMDHILESIEQVISREINRKLLAPFTLDDICAALKEM